MESSALNVIPFFLNCITDEILMRARANTMYIFHLSCCSDPLNFTSHYEPMCILFSSNAYYLISHVSTNKCLLALPIQEYVLLRKIIVNPFGYNFYSSNDTSISINSLHLYCNRNIDWIKFAFLITKVHPARNDNSWRPQ